MSTVPFQLRIGSPVETEEHFEDVDVDPLNELTDFERGLTQFCVDHNREVAIRVGDFERRVRLFPDLVSLLHRMPDLLEAFERDEPMQLGFPDDGFDIDCVPDGALVRCVVSRYGASRSSETFVCQRRDVAEALRRFAATIARQAVDDGYVNKSDADAFP